MNPIKINEDQCVGCGLCVYDCPNGSLHLVGGKACFDKPACIECGHCYAICPQGAIRMPGYPCANEPVVPMTVLDSDTLLSALRSRRTIRHFTQQPVEAEKLQKILEAGRYSPTGEKLSECVVHDPRKPAVGGGGDLRQPFQGRAAA